MRTSINFLLGLSAALAFLASAACVEVTLASGDYFAILVTAMVLAALSVCSSVAMLIRTRGHSIAGLIVGTLTVLGSIAVIFEAMQRLAYT